jgi:ABC-type nitrate/sulfonate/bicarbonate transport system substrate-binding protein
MPGTTISVSLATGKIPLVIGAPPQFENAGFNIKAPLAWIAQWQDPADFQMIVRPGISSVADLKGKVIGTTVPGSSTQLLASVALEKAGLTQHDYSFLAMGDIPSEVAAFYAGTVSALVLPASSLQPIINNIPGTKIAFDYYEQKVPWIGAGVVAYRPWAEKNADAVVAILNSLNQALKLVHADPTSVEPTIAKFVGAHSQASIDLQMKYLRERTLQMLSPVSIETLKSIYGAVREASGNSGLSEAYAESMVDNTYVKKISESK